MQKPGDGSSAYQGMYVEGILGPNGQYVPNARNADGSFIPLARLPDGGFMPGFNAPSGTIVPAIRQPNGSWVPSLPHLLTQHKSSDSIATRGSSYQAQPASPPYIPRQQDDLKKPSTPVPTSSIPPSTRPPTTAEESPDAGREPFIVENANGAPHELKTGFGEYIVDYPDGSKIRYVEVDVREERVIEVPKVEVHEIVHIEEVPDISIRENVIEVPEVKYETREVEVINEEEVVHEVPIKKVVKVPRERVREVEVPMTKLVEKVEEVVRTIEVEKPYVVEEQEYVDTYVKREVPTVVAQKLRPVMRQADQPTEVEAKRYEPVLYAVDVYIPRPIPKAVLSMGVVDEVHRFVDVPTAQYNSLVERLNPHLETPVLHDLFIKQNGGQIPMLPIGEIVDIVPPKSNAQILPKRTPVPLYR